MKLLNLKQFKKICYSKRKPSSLSLNGVFGVIHLSAFYSAEKISHPGSSKTSVVKDGSTLLFTNINLLKEQKSSLRSFWKITDEFQHTTSESAFKICQLNSNFGFQCWGTMIDTITVFFIHRGFVIRCEQRPPPPRLHMDSPIIGCAAGKLNENIHCYG